MKPYGRDLRLEILRLVNVQVASKTIPAQEMLTRAKELIAFVEADDDEFRAPQGDEIDG